MRVFLVACREPAGSYNRLLGVPYVFEHKTQYILVRDPHTFIVLYSSNIVKYWSTTVSWLL